MERKFDSETKNAMLPRGKLKAVNNLLVHEKDNVQLPELFKCAYILYLMIVLAQVHALDRVCYVSKAGLELMTPSACTVSCTPLPDRDL